MAKPAQPAAHLDLESGRLLLRGELCFDSIPALLSQAETLLGQGHGPLEIDLAEVGRVDSAGLALLIEWMRRARQQGRDIQFAHLPQQMLAIAEASDLAGMLPVVDAG